MKDVKKSPSPNKRQLSASLEQKKEFLLHTLEAEEKRRDAVENKASILIASNAILLGAIINFVLPLNTSGNFVIVWLQIALAIMTFGFVISSILISAQIFASFNQKKRSQIMDLGSNPENENNLFLFSRIAEFKKETYQDKIDNITDEEILNQLTSQVHNLSRLLVLRYKKIWLAHRVFMFGAVTFALFAVIKIFNA